MALNNSLQKKVNKPAPFSAVINSEGYKKLINNTLKDPKRANRFVASIVSAVSINQTLQECSPDTIVSCALLGESLELSPSPQLGQYWLVPYDDKKRGCKVAQFQLGVNGYKQLAIRSGQYLDLDAIEIKENGKPIFEFIEDDEVREDLPTIGYLAYFELLNGFKKTIYWSKEKVLNHADKYSQAFSKNATQGKYPKVSFADYEAGNFDPKTAWLYSSPWYSGFDGMALKTVLRQLISKWGIMSISMEKAFERDMATINDDGSYNYVDNQAENSVQQPDNVIDVESVVVEEEQAPPQDGFTEAEKAEIEAQEAAEAAAEAQENFFNN